MILTTTQNGLLLGMTMMYMEHAAVEKSPQPVTIAAEWEWLLMPKLLVYFTTWLIVGIRILSGALTEDDEALALYYANQVNDIYSCSWGPPDNGKSMDAPVELVRKAFKKSIDEGRGGKGSIFVFATGNGGALDDNCNFDGYTNSPYTITIGAIDWLNKHPFYSEKCSAQLAVTYSSGSGEALVSLNFLI